MMPSIRNEFVLLCSASLLLVDMLLIFISVKLGDATKENQHSYTTKKKKKKSTSKIQSQSTDHPQHKYVF